MYRRYHRPGNTGSLLLEHSQFHASFRPVQQEGSSKVDLTEENLKKRYNRVVWFHKQCKIGLWVGASEDQQSFGIPDYAKQVYWNDS